MQKPELENPWIDDIIYIFYRLILPSTMLAIIITGHLWQLPDEAREFCSVIFGLCIKATFGKKD